MNATYMRVSKAIIIGSGVAGMATAIRLAIRGYDVAIFEKNEYPGGKLYAFEKGGFRFDAGPSLFTQPENLQELFDLAGEPLENYFTFQPVDIACKYFFENGKTVNAYCNPERFSREMEEQLKEDPQKITGYLKRSRKLYENIGALFLDHSIHQNKTWKFKKLIKALSTVKLDYLFQSLNKYNNKVLDSPEAVQIFNRFATYNGSNPYKAPAMLSMVPHLEQNQGVFYPGGGMISITNALYKLAKDKGVRFLFNTPVQRIIHHEGRVKGVVVNSENKLADIVVSNSDIYFTYKNLLNNATGAKAVLKQERSSSAIIFYWGIKKQFDQFELHNVFFSRDYRKEFDAIFNAKEVSDDPTVYINITSKMETTHSPAGKENWFVMVNTPCDTGQNWPDIIQQLRKNVISKLSRMLGEELEALIETETVLDPIMIQQQTASFKGSIYGSGSNSRFAAFFRHANFTNSIKGLYFCGGSVHPGGGIPLCLKSAKIVDGLVTANT
ncbi:MAG: 1-hydroxycarotenoid 3,4-desaturase CrtD [Ferruginibacter sp.]